MRDEGKILYVTTVRRGNPVPYYAPYHGNKAMFTRDRSGTDPVRFSDRIGLLFTRDRSGTGPERIQNWTCCFAGPVSDPIRTGSRKVPCKHLDRFQTVPCKQKPIRSGSVRNGSGPVPCKRSLSLDYFRVI